MNALQSLAKILGPPVPSAVVSSERALDWFEASINLKLPKDYRLFCKTYGSCILGQYFVIQAPGTTSRGTRYDDQYVRERADQMKDWIGLDSGVPGFVPEKLGGWLPFGYAFGDPFKLYWSRTDQPSDDWSIVIHGPNIFEEHCVSFSDFLLLVKGRKLRAACLNKRLKKRTYEDFYDYFRRLVEHQR